MNNVHITSMYKIKYAVSTFESERLKYIQTLHIQVSLHRKWIGREIVQSYIQPPQEFGQKFIDVLDFHVQQKQALWMAQTEKKSHTLIIKHNT